MTPAIILSPVTTIISATYRWFQKCRQLIYCLSQLKTYVHLEINLLEKKSFYSISVYCSPIASKKIMENLSVSKFFSYIAGVFDPSDKALLLNIFADFHQNLNWPIGFSGP
jgi:hypothetical protein